ncbi:MAG TPA: hypothetical protein VF230_04805 [Acidimicrobiales bacterium]
MPSVEASSTLGDDCNLRLVREGALFVVIRDGERVANGAGDGVDELVAEIEHAIAELSPTHVFVHAGVVGTPDGAIVIPATSGAGKTTLVAAFLRAGATYYSDEYAVLDADGNVHPYPRRLGIRDDEGRQRPTDAAEFGAPTATEPSPVVAVLALRRGTRTRLRPLTAGQSVVKMLEHTVIAQIDPPRALGSLSAAAQDAVGFTGTRGEADVFARNFLRRAPWRRAQA